MVERIIDGLLPGTRSLRPPLIGGLLWCLLIWLVFTDFIPLPGTSAGWVEEAYVLFGALGPIAGVAVLSILVFVIGAALGNVSDGVSRVTGAIPARTQSTIAWHRHARRNERRLEETIPKLQKEIESIKMQDIDASEKENVINDKMLKRREHEISQARSRLQLLEKAKVFRFYIRQTPDVRKIVGPPPATANAGLEQELVEFARRDGQESAMAENGVLFHPNEIYRNGDFDRSRFSDELIAELETDPLEVLRSLDEALFLEVDRLRAEREVRLAFATPLLGLAIYGAVRFSNPWIILVAVLPLAIMIRHSSEAEQERTRVLRLIRLHNLRTPALNRAYEQGGKDVLRRMEEIEEQKKTSTNGIVGLGGAASNES